MKRLLASAVLLLFTAAASAAPGDVLWANSFDSAGSFTSLDLTLSDGYICVGTGGGNVVIMETDADGNELWSVSYGGAAEDEPEDVKALPDGGFLVCGQSESYTVDIEDAFLWKLDATGALVWEQYFDGPGYTNFQSLILNGNGDIVCAGYSQSDGMGYQGIVAVYSPDGDLLDSAVIGTAVDEAFNEIQQTPEGAYILCGHTKPAGTEQCWLVKLNGDLDLEWTREYDGIVRARAQSIVLAAGGGYLIGGFVGNFGDADAWLLRLDTVGDVIWEQTYGGDYWNSCNDLMALGDGGFAVAGFNSPVSDTWHPWVFTIGADGALRWETIYDAQSGGTALKLAEDSQGDLLACGQIRVGWNSYALLMKIENAPVTPVSEGAPSATKLASAYPNPFNPKTTIRFTLAQEQDVNLSIVDIQGRQITTLASGILTAGEHSIRWEGRNSASEPVASGTYLAVLRCESSSQMTKLTLLQ